MDTLSKYRPLFLVLAILGFLFVNLPFLYFSFFEKEIYLAAMTNGVALIFMGEAFLLMFFFAFLVAKLQWKKPGWFSFIILSLLGSLAFSIPLFLYLHAGPKPPANKS